MNTEDPDDETSDRDTMSTPAPTPRTDWVEARVWDRYKQAEDITPEDNARAAIREACEHARTLERELTSAQAALAAKDREIERITKAGDRLNIECGQYAAGCASLRSRAERAEAELTRLDNLRVSAEQYASDFRAERDQLRAEVNLLRKKSEDKHA